MKSPQPDPQPDITNSLHFPKHIPHKIHPTFPYTFSSCIFPSQIRKRHFLNFIGLRPILGDWDVSILCSFDNEIRFDTRDKEDPDEMIFKLFPTYFNKKKLEESFKYIRSQLALRRIKHFYHLIIDLSRYMFSYIPSFLIRILE